MPPEISKAGAVGLGSGQAEGAGPGLEEQARGRSWRAGWTLQMALLERETVEEVGREGRGWLRRGA